MDDTVSFIHFFLEPRAWMGSAHRSWVNGHCRLNMYGTNGLWSARLRTTLASLKGSPPAAAAVSLRTRSPKCPYRHARELVNYRRLESLLGSCILGHMVGRRFVVARVWLPLNPQVQSQSDLGSPTYCTPKRAMETDRATASPLTAPS